MIKPVSPSTIDYKHLAAFIFGTRLIHKLPLLFDFPHKKKRIEKADFKLFAQYICQCLKNSIQEMNKWH
jgi:hypothetical protein